jgi:DNA adenine methylase
MVGRVFGTNPVRLPRINLLRLEEELSAVHLRLATVTIEHLPYGEFIARYDRAGTCFYLDPPYWGCENFYGDNFSADDFPRLAAALAGICGKFILSINDVPEIRDIFKAFTIATVPTAYSMQSRAYKRVTELLIRNF